MRWRRRHAPATPAPTPSHSHSCLSVSNVLSRGGGLQLPTQRAGSCQRLSHNTLGAEEQVIIAALSPSSPLSWLRFFFFFFSKNKCCAALEIQVGAAFEETHGLAAALFHRHRPGNQVREHLGSSPLASCQGDVCLKQTASQLLCMPLLLQGRPFLGEKSHCQLRESMTFRRKGLASALPVSEGLFHGLLSCIPNGNSPDP